jgi:hypothetical protein
VPYPPERYWHMARQAIIVLGAGASKDCASEVCIRDAAYQPPLTSELFDSRFAEILHEYPLAEQAAPCIRNATQSGTVALEKYLREELRDSPFKHFQRRYFAIPLYLQHLLWDVGRRYARQPDNYDLLVMEALRLDRVTFITLNYDTILDDRLAIDEPIERIEDYNARDRKWSLIKLHGSLNWGRRVEASTFEDGIPMASLGKPKTYASEFDSAEMSLDPEIVYMGEESLEEMRTEVIERTDPVGLQGHTRCLYYPALSAPLGAKDEIVCPGGHVERVHDHMRYAYKGLNILVIGYSGLDREVLNLLGSSGRPVKSLKVVNRDFDESMETVQTLSGSLRFSPTEEMVWGSGFNAFAQSGAMAEFLGSIEDDETIHLP